ncbi:MAG TPA: glutamate racemase [Nitrospirae bacterium]|nr:glutamate racemase [Nitrospirota bacterium]
MDKRPIGIFDSGIGGLTVLKEIVAQLPGEDTIYLGDTARVPYGIRSSSTVIRYSYQNADFLAMQGIKILVVACNTVSAVAIEKLRGRLSIPVVGVIEPGAMAASKVSARGSIGVIGTVATVESGAYQRVLKQLIPDVDITARACPLFVPLVEEGWTDGNIARNIVRTYLKSLRRHKVDTLVLGCTHYPLLKDLIGEYMGEETVLIDSAVETAKETERVLKSEGIMNSGGRTGKRRFYVTDSPARFRTVGQRFLGEGITDIDLVDIV